MIPVQTPPPGSHLLLHGGDSLTVTLRMEGRGRAYLRTNIGNAAVRRAETISLVRTGTASSGQDWHDLPMSSEGDGLYFIRLALIETGHFEAKAFFMPENSEDPVWPGGDNLHVNVSPAGYCCSNSIYCAFVRQFGPNKNGVSSHLPPGIDTREIADLDKAGYTVIPPSGTFRDLIGELDHIFKKLKCRILHLLPVNPTPSVYARMGRYGSPYASLGFTAVDPSLAVFDTKATPLEQFLELVDAVHGRSGKLFIDIAVNHTGWAAEIHEKHPEWLVREPDGHIVSPGAWGNIWADLTELNYDKRELWKYISKVFLTWCRRGVDGFRCDAGYMIPVPAWEYIIAEVRTEYPDTIFLLEGLGGDPAVTARLLDYANMNWAYSELFQNYSREQIEGYLNYAWKQSSGFGLMVHYAETHDNSRLAAVSQTYAHMRTGLCALASVNGAFGFANGVEWYASEKIDVHESRALSWGADPNQIDFIGRLNSIMLTHPAFHNNASIRFLDSHSPNALIFLRTSEAGDRRLLVMVNLDCEHRSPVEWTLENSSGNYCDLISSGEFSVEKQSDGSCRAVLEPGAVHCLTPDSCELLLLRRAPALSSDRLSRTEFQEAKNMALKTLCRMRGSQVLHASEDPVLMGRQLLESPENFLESLEPDILEPPYVVWKYPDDANRMLMIPAGRFLLVTAPTRFRAVFLDNEHVISQYDSLIDARGRHFVLFNPPDTRRLHREALLKIAACEEGKLSRVIGNLLFLAPDVETTRTNYTHAMIREHDLTFMQANGRGALSHLRLDLPAVSSRYDAVLLANLSTELPEDRHIMFRRIRVWMLHHARTQEVSLCCLKSFDRAPDGGGLWHYYIPAGNGLSVKATLKIEVVSGKNQVRVSLFRSPADPANDNLLPDGSPVKFIVRPDIEDRNFHFSTKARDVEKIWSAACTFTDRGFDFAPAPTRKLSMTVSAGKFIRHAEWTYMLWQRNEADRGLDPDTDLFSPGYFEVPLHGGELFQIAAAVRTPMEPEPLKPEFINTSYFKPVANLPLESAMLNAMRDFVVKRGKYKTVIAGYPWFLDWGRDTLIAARGLVAAPEFIPDVKEILLQFALFAENGTIPNIIHGDTVGNRDTSDAPLWLFTAVSDLCKAEKSLRFLDTVVRDSTPLRDILESTARGILSGTPNGIKADPESGLVFSPPHFTWMDTNYPAGTPREGYPIEIQALWFAALNFLAEFTEKDEWKTLAGKVQGNIMKYFRSRDGLFLSDCLHCKPGTPAKDAVRDDHIRPNQIFAITLGAVKDRLFCKSILETCSVLLIPGAMRSLADRPVEYRLPVYAADGRLLNNPERPYQGRYEGDEDTRRKISYHNGTAWTWPFPSYCEAYAMTYRSTGKATARSILASSERLFHSGCVGHMPEILDGDYPHRQRGCDAQAWGATEFYRVWKKLHS